MGKNLCEDGSVKGNVVMIENWLKECLIFGRGQLEQSIDIDPKRRSGVPVLKGTRFTVAQTLAELAESSGVNEVANNFDLNAETIKQLLYGFSSIIESYGNSLIIEGK